jgi:hypothetical protein
MPWSVAASRCNVFSIKSPAQNEQRRGAVPAHDQCLLSIVGHKALPTHCPAAVPLVRGLKADVERVISVLCGQGVTAIGPTSTKPKKCCRSLSTRIHEHPRLDLLA